MSRPASRSQLILAFAAVYLIWGSTYLAIRIGVETIPPFFMAGIRFTVAGILLYGWMRFRGSPRPTLIQWRSATIVGFLLLVAGNGVVAWAEQTVPSALTALIVAAVPMWMALMEWTMNDIRPHPAVMIGLVVGFAGIAMLVNPGVGGASAPGFFALLGATISWAAGSLYSRKAKLPESPFLSTAMEMVAGGAMLFIVSLFMGEWSVFDAGKISVHSAEAVGYLVVFGSLIGLTSYVWLLRATTSARVSTYAYINPVVAMFLGWLIAGEALTDRMVTAAAVIIGAVALIITYRSAGQSDRTKREPLPAVLYAAEEEQ